MLTNPRCQQNSHIISPSVHRTAVRVPGFQGSRSIPVFRPTKNGTPLRDPEIETQQALLLRICFHTPRMSHSRWKISALWLCPWRSFFFLLRLKNSASSWLRGFLSHWVCRLMLLMLRKWRPPWATHKIFANLMQHNTFFGVLTHDVAMKYKSWQLCRQASDLGFFWYCVCMYVCIYIYIWVNYNNSQVARSIHLFRNWNKV